MWENVDIIIQRIESQMDLFTKTTDLYDSKYCSKNNEECSFKLSHIIRAFVHMNKPFEFEYKFKSHCTSINKRSSKLGGYLCSIANIKRNKFQLFGNESLSSSNIFP